ncbi:SU10 major capsid protein [Fundidesulfovibrio putealis]|uniref:SU10 major capsid protein n=1 Tax=Fundidesulfovibrio putealis TaxID=270496 RepID=UPI0012EBAF50|nr:DUF5309 family protein [Fundidesulfovibrio putealis]
MANEVSTFMTNGMSNIKESVGDAIYTISPTDTVFMNLVKKGKATSVKEEWLEDSDRTPGVNAKAEEWTGSASAVTQPVRKYNYTQIFADRVDITDSMESAAKYGRVSEIERLIEKGLRQISKDAEYAFINNSAAPSAHVSGTGGKLKGALGFVTTNTYNFGGTTTNACDLTEPLFQDGIQAAWSSGGNPSVVLAPPAVARTISGFVGNGRLSQNVEASKKTVIQAVDFYQSQFGMVKVHTSRWMEPKDVSTVKYDYMLILEPEKWEIAWLKKTKVERQAKQGLVTPVVISAEATLKCYNEAANFKMENISRV